MNNINLKIELCAEDRARLDNILEAIKSLGGAPCVETGATPAAKEASAPKKAPEAKQEAPAPAEPAPQPQKEAEPTPAPAPAEAAPEVSTAELQSKVVQLVSAGKKAETRAIITKYAETVSAIPADKRVEVLQQLNALEG